MNTTLPASLLSGASPRRRGSVLVVVLWIVFGLISITLYFANSMSFELRASDNRVAGVEAEQAIEGGRRYIMCVLSNLNSRGAVPDPAAYLHDGVQIGDAKVWFIGRTNVESINLTNLTTGLVDEASKINLNASGFPLTNLQYLPRMTQPLAYNIMAWASTNTANNVGAAESDTYMTQSPPYLCKNGPFETVGELRLVYNMTIDILYGEDANLNGFLDPNENDGDALPPTDNQDGRLDPGLFEYLTVYTSEPTNDTNGNARIAISGTLSTQTSGTLYSNLATNFGTGRAQQIFSTAGLPIPGAGGGNAGNVTFTSPLDFYIKSQMTAAEFQVIEPGLCGPNLKGLINVNTAGSQVLQCLPGMDLPTAQQLVSARQSALADPNNQNSVCWLKDAVQPQLASQIGPWITGRSYQFSADIAAVGHDGRGYRRTLFVIDTSTGTPVIVYRQDRTSLGWALGAAVRNQLLSANK